MLEWVPWKQTKMNSVGIIISYLKAEGLPNSEPVFNTCLIYVQTIPVVKHFIWLLREKDHIE
jgi:hypothetical protein